MIKQIENLIRKSAFRDIQIEMLKKEEQGLIISHSIIDYIINELEELDEKTLDQVQLDLQELKEKQNE